MTRERFPDPAHPIVVLKTYGDNEYVSDTTYAYVEMSRALGGRLYDLVQHLKAQQGLGYPQTFQHVYWDDRLLWFAGDSDDLRLDTVCEQVSELETLYLPAGSCPFAFHGVNDPRWRRIECRWLVVEADQVFWKCRTKGDAQLTTASLPLEDLVHYAKGEPPTRTEFCDYGVNPFAHACPEPTRHLDPHCLACEWVRTAPQP